MRHSSIFLALCLALLHGAFAQQLAVSPAADSGPSETWVTTRMIGSEESGENVPHQAILLYAKSEDWGLVEEEPGTYYDAQIDLFHLEPIDSRALTFAMLAGTTWIPGVIIVPERKNLRAPALFAEDFGLPYETRLDLGDSFDDFWDASDQVTLHFQAEGKSRRTELTFSLSRAPADFSSPSPSYVDDTEPELPLEFSWSLRWRVVQWQLTITNPNSEELEWNWIKIHFLDGDGFRLKSYEVSCDAEEYWEDCEPYKVPANSEKTFHGRGGYIPNHTRQAITGVELESDPGGVWQSD